MKIAFRDWNPRQSTLDFLATVNTIIRQYQNQGYRLTLRQLYYQLVSKNMIENSDKQYKKLGNTLNEARLAGFVSWDAIEDRTRRVSEVKTYEDAESAFSEVVDYYRIDRNDNQPVHVEVWIEKDALSQVVWRAASQYQAPVMVNRGYSSASAMFSAYRRLSDQLDHKERAVILYLGDHDPSGLDMIRDVSDRLKEMLDHEDQADQLLVKPIALTRDQIDQYNPPPNPAKVTDSRAGAYISKHGRVSWEVDALPPDVLDKLIRAEIENIIDLDAYEEQKVHEADERAKMKRLIDFYKGFED